MSKTLNDMIIGLEDYFVSGKVPLTPNSTSYLGTCWKILDCTKKRCPLYGKTKVRCWQFHGTFCQGKTKVLPFERKFEDCRSCEVFQYATANEMNRVKEAIYNVLFMLNGPETDGFVKVRSIMKNIDTICITYALSAQEAKLLPLLLSGGRREEVAQELGISMNTLKTHIKHLLKKTDAKSVQDLRQKLGTLFK